MTVGPSLGFLRNDQEKWIRIESKPMRKMVFSEQRQRLFPGLTLKILNIKLFGLESSVNVFLIKQDVAIYLREYIIYVLISGCCFVSIHVFCLEINRYIKNLKNLVEKHAPLAWRYQVPSVYPLSITISTYTSWQVLQK